MFKRYTVRLYHGAVLLLDQEGRLVDLDELRPVIDGLNQTLQQVEKGVPQQILKQAAARQYVEQAIRASERLFEPDQDAIKRCGKGVYFIADPTRPGLIKIGRTTNLHQRLKSLYWDIAKGQYELEVLFFVKTPQHVWLELTLHEMFQADRLGGEWFHEDRILNFIEQFKP